MLVLLLAGQAHAACTVTLVSPAPNATVTAAPTFRWTSSGDCSQYRVQVARTTAFQVSGTTNLGWERMKSEAMSSSTYTTLTASGTAGYLWRVQSRDSAGTTANTAARRLTLTASDADHDGYAATAYGGTDCDDSDAAIHPGATETCNSVDDDCDGLVDIGAADAPMVYHDGDGDGYGDVSTSSYACPGGSWVENNDDCNDVDPGVGTAVSWWLDSDGDGYGDPAIGGSIYCSAPEPGLVADATDCDDSDATRNPGVSYDPSCDHIDQNCDGVDPGTPTWVSVGVSAMYDGAGGHQTVVSADPYDTVSDCYIGEAIICWDDVTYASPYASPACIDYALPGVEGGDPGFQYVCTCVE